MAYFGLFAYRSFVLSCASGIKRSKTEAWLCDATSGLREGVCTFGWNDALERCASQAWNSHAVAFAVDVALTLAALRYAFVGKGRADSRSSPRLLPAVVAALILCHGLLRLLFAKEFCVLGGSVDASAACYLLFVFSLVATIVFFFWPSSEPLFLARNAVVASLFTFLIYQTTLQAPHFSVPCLFASSHVLVSAAGLWAPNRALISRQLGWAFLVATLVGLVEFLDCHTFAVNLRQLGGHVTYDLALHAALITQLRVLSVKGDAKRE